MNKQDFQSLYDYIYSSYMNIMKSESVEDILEICKDVTTKTYNDCIEYLPNEYPKVKLENLIYCGLHYIKISDNVNTDQLINNITLGIENLIRDFYVYLNYENYEDEDTQKRIKSRMNHLFSSILEIHYKNFRIIYGERNLFSQGFHRQFKDPDDNTTVFEYPIAYWLYQIKYVLDKNHALLTYARIDILGTRSIPDDILFSKAPSFNQIKIDSTFLMNYLENVTDRHEDFKEYLERIDIKEGKDIPINKVLKEDQPQILFTASEKPTLRKDNKLSLIDLRCGIEKQVNATKQFLYLRNDYFRFCFSVGSTDIIFNIKHDVFDEEHVGEGIFRLSYEYAMEDPYLDLNDDGIIEVYLDHDELKTLKKHFITNSDKRALLDKLQVYLFNKGIKRTLDSIPPSCDFYKDEIKKRVKDTKY